eukprot:COSAG01_NODE_4618_length_4876_cov_8.446305_2_plen_100_part_00
MSGSSDDDEHMSGLMHDPGTEEEERALHSLVYARRHGTLSLAEEAAILKLEQHRWAWKVSVHIIEAKDLIAADVKLGRANSSDPYVSKARFGSSPLPTM